MTLSIIYKKYHQIRREAEVPKKVINKFKSTKLIISKNTKKERVVNSECEQ